MVVVAAAIVIFLVVVRVAVVVSSSTPCSDHRTKTSTRNPPDGGNAIVRVRARATIESDVKTRPKKIRIGGQANHPSDEL